MKSHWTDVGRETLVCVILHYKCLARLYTARTVQVLNTLQTALGALYM